VYALLWAAQHFQLTNWQIADYAALLRECGRILRPGGLFLSAEWSYYVVHNTAPDQSSARFPHLTRFYDILGDMVEQRNHHLRTERIPDFIMDSGLFDVLLDVGYPVRSPATVKVQCSLRG
jgi:SAM-dependent methyltransferase